MSRQQKFEENRRIVKDLTKTLNCRDTNRVREDACAALEKFPYLRPDTGEVRLTDGSQAKSLRLHGTVGMFYRGKEYFVPTEFHLTEDYPKRGPTCYVRPTQRSLFAFTHVNGTAEMLVKQSHMHVDALGLCYLPYLHEWNKRTSNVVGAVDALSAVFSRDPFIYAKPQQPAQPPPPQPYPTQAAQPQARFPSAAYPTHPPVQHTIPVDRRPSGAAASGADGDLAAQVVALSTKLEEEKTCAVCMSEPKNALIVPCGHVSLCMTCAGELKEKKQPCPICRGDIQTLVKAFVV